MNQNKPAAALESCPCCEGKAEMTKGYTVQENWPQGVFYRVFCGVCQLRQLFHATPEAAAKAWNRRAPKASAVPEGVVTGLRKVYEWMTKLPVPTDGIIPQLKRLKGVMHILEESAPQAEEAPAYVPQYSNVTDHNGKLIGVKWDNAKDAPPVASATSHVQLSIDTPEFRGLMLAASTAWPTQVKQIKALVAHIDAWKDACCARARAEDREQVNEEIAGAVWRDDLQAAMTQDRAISMEVARDQAVLAEYAAIARAEAAESKLAAIHAGVEGLKSMTGKDISGFYYMETEDFVNLDELRALLTPLVP